MAEERYIWCRTCNDVHHVTAFDKAPEFVVTQGGTKEQSVDDWGAFMKRHAGHRLEALKGVGEGYTPGSRPMDPMKVGYTEVTNGQDWFVVRSSRKSIDQPLNFELVPGRLRATGVAVEVQENEIRKEMKHHFPWGATGRLGDEKIELFIKLFREMLRDLNPDEIKVCGHSYADSSVVYGLLDAPVIETLMDKCAPHFPLAELEGIRRFCETHMGRDGVMALLIRRHYRIQESI